MGPKQLEPFRRLPKKGRVASNALTRKKGRLKSRRRERSSRGRTPPTRIGATSCGMHRNSMPFGRERWHRPPRFAHADSLRMGVQRGCEVHQVLQHIAADRLQLDLSRPSTPGWRASTEEVCASACLGKRLVRAAPHLTSQASTRALDLCSTAVCHVPFFHLWQVAVEESRFQRLLGG
jgi:hypothetical protein